MTRIETIVEAATLLFLRQGYERTQISHIAKAVGVSVGTIYHDFAGKKEIMHFVLKCTVAPYFIYQEFEGPITDDLFIGIEDEIVSLLERNAINFAKLGKRTILKHNFEEFISNTFDLLAQYAVGCLFIEKNQHDFPFLAKHYHIYRKKFFDIMNHCINSFVQNKTVRPLKDLELTTILIIETLTWWAMDRRYISLETIDIPLEKAKEICMDNILSAYQA